MSVHGKGSMDGIDGTIKNVIFRKVKSGQIVIHNPKNFLMLPWNLYHLLLLRLDRMK